MMEDNVCCIHTKSLSDLVDMVNDFHSVRGSCKTFDLGSLEVRCPVGKKHFFLTASNVIIRNGSIWLGKKLEFNGAILFVDGRNVTFERIIIKGGTEGLFVRPGGGVTMHDCEIQDAYAGMAIGNCTKAYEKLAPAGSRATLSASNVKITGYKYIGILGGPTAAIHLSECSIGGHARNFDRDCNTQAICLRGPDCELVARKVSCTDYPDYYISCENGGKGILDRCHLTGRLKDFEVTGSGTILELWYCKLSKKPDARNEGYIKKMVRCK